MKGLGHVSRHLEGNQSPPGTKEGHQAARRPAALTRHGDEARPTPAPCRVGNKLTQVALQPRPESGRPEEAGRPQTNSPGTGKTEEQGFSPGSRLWPSGQRVCRALGDTLGVALGQRCSQSHRARLAKYLLCQPGVGRVTRVTPLPW